MHHIISVDTLRDKAGPAVQGRPVVAGMEIDPLPFFLNPRRKDRGGRCSHEARGTSLSVHFNKNLFYSYSSAAMVPYMEAL